MWLQRDTHLGSSASIVAEVTIGEARRGSNKVATQHLVQTFCKRRYSEMSPCRLRVACKMCVVSDSHHHPSVVDYITCATERLVALCVLRLR